MRERDDAERADRPDRPDREHDAPRHAADPSRRRRITLGRSARLGRVRHRRGEVGPVGTGADEVDGAAATDPDGSARTPATESAPTAQTTEAQTTEAQTTEAQTTDAQTTDAQTTDTPSTDAAPEAPDGGEPSAAADGKSRGRERLKAALSRPGRGQVLAAVLLLLFGLAVVTQVRLVTQDSTYANARREDLIQLLDGLTQENRRLEGEQTDLERTKTNLQSGADAQQVAREEAEKRIEVLSILAGTVPAEGQGIRMTITDPQNKVTAEILLDAIEEMRDAGAEVIEVNDSIRLVASSSFGVGPNGQLQIDGQPVTRPIVIEVIGDPHSLSEGANFRGGIVSEITSSKVGGTVEIKQLENVSIDSLHTPKTNQYARPSSPEPTG